MRLGLTRAQAQALAFIREYRARNGFSPSYQEIAEGIGLAAKSGVKRIVDALERRGCIRRSSAYRGLEVIRPAEAHLKRILDVIDNWGGITPDHPAVIAARADLEGAE